MSQFTLTGEARSPEAGFVMRQYSFAGNRELRVGRFGLLYAVGWTTSLAVPRDLATNEKLREFTSQNNLQPLGFGPVGEGIPLGMADLQRSAGLRAVEFKNPHAQGRIYWRAADRLAAAGPKFTEPTLTLITPFPHDTEYVASKLGETSVGVMLPIILNELPIQPVC